MMATDMACPKCTRRAVTVVDSRIRNGQRWRRRRCTACGTRWNTLEIEEHTFARLDDALASIDSAIGSLQAVRAFVLGMKDDPLEQDEAA